MASPDLELGAPGLWEGSSLCSVSLIVLSLPYWPEEQETHIMVSDRDLLLRLFLESFFLFCSKVPDSWSACLGEFPQAGKKLTVGTLWKFLGGGDEHPSFIFKSNVQEGRQQRFPELRLTPNR